MLHCIMQEASIFCLNSSVDIVKHAIMVYKLYIYGSQIYTAEYNTELKLNTLKRRAFNGQKVYLKRKLKPDGI